MQSIQTNDDDSGVSSHEGDEDSEDDVPDMPGNGQKHRAPPIDKARTALEEIEAIIRIARKTGGGYQYADFDRVTGNRCAAIAACLRHFLGSRFGRFIDASITAAMSIHGWWNISILEDEDISGAIKLHLQAVGKYASAEDIVNFLRDPDVRTKFGLNKTISVRTAQRWLHREGGKPNSFPSGEPSSIE